MKKIVILAISSLVLFLVSCNGSKKIPTTTNTTTSEIHFVESGQLTPLLEQAKAENKLVFLDFYTSWCLPCRIMDEEVFTQKDIADKMNENFINYKINAEKDNGPSLSTIFNVYAYPTLLMLDADGNILERKDGSMSLSQFSDMADRALATSF